MALVCLAGQEETKLIIKKERSMYRECLWNEKKNFRQFSPAFIRNINIPKLAAMREKRKSEKSVHPTLVRS